MWFIQQLLLVFVFFLIFGKYLKIIWKARSLPPGPSPFPIFGNLWTLCFNMNPETLRKVSKLYGNIYTVWIGETPVIVLQGYKAVKNAIVSHSEELSGRPVSNLMKDMSNGKGIVVSNGHIWKQQRRFSLMTLRNLGLGKHGLESRIQKEAQGLVEVLATQNGKPIDVSNFIVHSVANVISAVVFGHRFSIDDPTFQKLVTINQEILDNLGSKWGTLYNAFPWLMKHLPGPHQKVFKNREYLGDFVSKEVRIHQQNKSPEEPDDIIYHYLAQIEKTIGDPDSTFDMANLTQIVADLFTAGTESTATSLQWAILFMLAYPDIQEKIHKELDEVLHDSSAITYEDRKRLPYTNAVIHEIQRFGNIASVGVMRRSIKDITLDGYPIKKDTNILPNLDSVLRDPQHWKTPNKFNPEHFLDKDGNFKSNEAFIPFSAGHRICLGEQLARFELVIFFITLMRTFRFQLPEGVTEVNTKYIVKTTLQPHPYKVCVIQRRALHHL
ncbi:cytochrome P450 2J6-like [Bufo gargarizans]|uniref:cytochrome P450 2J6-like n=1 Tax=Bufo gargarizans TaxID=30331 RepID=UPI001CF0DB71|nr:cytochrome P450 2J6-like [Bufo gargarizans]